MKAYFCLLSIFFITSGCVEISKYSGENNSHMLNDYTCYEKEGAVDNKQEHYLFVGLTGTGKSTLINTLMGKVIATAGVSAGCALTTKCQKYQQNHIVYIDTPGLGDATLKDKAAREIEIALKTINGKAKIFFVFSMFDGIVCSSDLASLDAVMDAIDVDAKEFNIIVNRVAPTIQKKFLNSTYKQDLIDVINCGKYKTENIFFINVDIKMLSDDEIKFIPMDEELTTFFKSTSKSMVIPKERVGTVDYDSFKKNINPFAIKISKHRWKFERNTKISEEFKQQLKEVVTSL